MVLISCLSDKWLLRYKYTTSDLRNFNQNFAVNSVNLYVGEGSTIELTNKQKITNENYIPLGIITGV